MKRLTAEGDKSPDKEGFVKGIAVDLVIFGFHDKQLKILLIKHTNTDLYALPGGYIGKKENLDAAAWRILEARTSLKNIYVEQFYVFGDYHRNDPSVIEKIMRGRNAKVRPNHWVFDRFFSVGYYSLIDYTKAVPRPDSLSESCDWYDINSLPPLILDHKQIVGKALQTLQDNLDKKLIGFNLLKASFTMNDLQHLYEAVLNKKLHRANFQRKMLSLGILEKVEKKSAEALSQRPYVYRFKKASGTTHQTKRLAKQYAP